MLYSQLNQARKAGTAVREDWHVGGIPLHCVPGASVLRALPTTQTADSPTATISSTRADLPPYEK